MTIDEGGVVRLRLRGELDLATVEAVAGQIGRALDEPGLTELVIDLAGLTFCDSSGIDALLVAREAALRHGTGFRVVRPRGIVRRALVATGVYDLLTAA